MEAAKTREEVDKPKSLQDNPHVCPPVSGLSKFFHDPSLAFG